MRAIPEHQRTPNFKKFTEIFFDRRWHEVYTQIKQMWTMFDPMEIDQDFLGYLSIYYHMFDLLTPTTFAQREFIRDMIWMLKRKGTYTEFYIIWRTIANTINALNIYEKWHDKDIIYGEHTAAPPSGYYDPVWTGDTHVLDHEWQEYVYVEKPEYRFQKPVGGADIGWYNRYYGLSGESIVDTRPPSAFYNYPVKLDNNPTLGAPEYGSIPNLDIDKPMYRIGDDRILSTHYKMEIDVSTEPLLHNAIVNKPLWDELWQYWEYVRPVNRVVDYNILIAPITDFSGCFVELYDHGGSAYDKTRVLVDMRTQGGWISPHIIPDPYFPSCSPSGTISPSGDVFYGESPSGGCRWVVKHPLNSKYLHTMAVDEFYEQIIPDDIEIVDNKTVIYHFSTAVLGYAVIKRSQRWDLGGNPNGDWSAYHYLEENEVITEAHDYTGGAFSDFKIYGNITDSTDPNYVVEEHVPIDTAIVPASSGDFTFYVPSSSGESAAWIQPITAPQQVWEVPHHLYYRGVMTAVYDWNNKQIHQYHFRLTGIDRAEIRFHDEYNDGNGASGYAVFMPVGNFSLEQLIEDFTDILRNGVTWRGAEFEGDLNNDTWSATGSIEQTEIYETDEYIYVNVKLGKDVEGSFREFGVYNSHGDMMVYTKSSEIYKPAGTTLVLHFRIKKADEHQCGAGGLPTTETCY
jgi:hypothetical protein